MNDTDPVKQLEEEMKEYFISVPFKSDTGSGLREFNGIAKFSPAGIVIEYESKIMGIFAAKVNEVRIGQNEILDIRFRKGILKFFSRIHIRLKTFSKLAELPNENGKVILKIKREDWDRAREAVEQTISWLGGEPAVVIGEPESQVEELHPHRHR